MASALFVGVAEEYHRYRVPYPKEIFDWIIKEYRLDGRGRLLDSGCGTGQVCLPLSPWFEDVIAIDPEPEMLHIAASAARKSGKQNITFRQMQAEDVTDKFAPLRMATFGRSFHWTDRVLVATRLFKLIEPGGGLVILDSSNVWHGSEPWKSIMMQTILDWLGEKRRTGQGPLHEEVLASTPFGEPQVINIVRCHTWTIDSLIGHLYSHPFTSRAAFGERAEGFERDLRQRLSNVVGGDCFTEDIEFTIFSARRRP